MTPTSLILLVGLSQSVLAPPKSDVPVDVRRADSALAPLESRPIDTLFYDEPGDGRLWVRGADYKASFGADGACFIPFLGAEAPRNYPARFTLDAVTLGGEAVDFDAPEVSRTGDDVLLERGAVQERYAIALDSIEQSFVFDDLPGAGELVLRIGVDTDLKAEPDGAGWRFVGPHGGLRYGAATVLDASGDSLSIPADWTGEGLELSVPAWFVANAELPLVVDPVLSTGFVANLSSNERSADVAFDPSWGMYMVVVEYEFSAIDSDVRVYEVSGTGPGTLGGNGTWIDVTSQPWRGPRIACRNVGNAFMVVATVGTGLSRYVGGRVRDLDVTVMNPSFVVSGTLSDSFNPDVGGDARSGFAINDPGFVVVWEKAFTPGVDHDLFMRSYDVQGQPLTPPTGLASAIGQLLHGPVISKSAGRGSPYEYMVAWSRRDTSNSQRIQARRVALFGAPVGPVFDVATGGFNANPEVSIISSERVVGQQDRASVIVYTSAPNSTVQEDVFAVVCSGSTPHTPTNLSESDGWAPEQPQRDPCVSCDGDQWTIAYSEKYPTSSLDYDVHMLTANLVGDRLGLSERHQLLADSGSPEGDPRIASRWASGDVASPSNMDQSLVVWTDDPISNSGIEGGHVATTSAVACGRQYCEPNPNSRGIKGWLAAYGDTSTTAPKTLIAQDLPLNTASFILTSASTNFVPNVGGGAGNLCLGPVGFGRYSNLVGSSGATGTYVLVIDPTQIPQPMGTVSAMAGQSWYFQCWHRDSAGGTATSNLTNAVEIPFQ